MLAGLWSAALLAAVRGTAVWAGSYVGCSIGRAELEIRRRLWQGMITQVRESTERNYHVPPAFQRLIRVTA